MQTSTSFLKCLSDDTRLLAVLLIAREQELCVCELVDAMDIHQPKISRHLAQLRNCEILLDRRKDQWVFYRLNPALPKWALSIIDELGSAEKKRLAAIRKNLKNMDCRPARS